MSEKTNQEKVKRFMELGGQQCPSSFIYPSKEILKLREALIEEELTELYDACQKYNNEPLVIRAPWKVQIADALCDIMYVVYGTANAWGVTLDDNRDEWYEWSIVSNEYFIYSALRGYYSDYMYLASIGNPAVSKALDGMISFCKEGAARWRIPLQKCFDEVHRSNMTKFVRCTVCEDSTNNCENCKGEKYVILKNAEGKIQKPKTYEAPNLKQFIWKV